MNFSGISLPHGLMLAPMAGVTDSSMRRLCGLYGAEYAVTEMVSAKALVYEQNSRPAAPIKTASLCIVKPEEKLPVAVQIFGSEPEFLAEAARLLSTGTYRGFSGVMPAAVDINMGCPVRKVVSNGEGSALMKDPEKIFNIVSAVVKASLLPVTVKLRAGWDSDSLNAAECAAAAADAGAAAVCIHARTREMFYNPGILPEIIRQVKEKVPVPVFGNGDITDAQSARALLRETGCDGLAVARGALGNPWVFAEIAAALDGKEYVPPTAAEQQEAALRLLHWSIEEKGERRGIAEAKFTLGHFFRGKRGAGAAREALMNAMRQSDIEEIFTSFFGDSNQ